MNIQYHVGNNSPVVLILSHTFLSSLLLIAILILSSHLTQVLHVATSLQVFQPKIFHAFLFSPCVLHALLISSSLMHSSYYYLVEYTL